MRQILNVNIPTSWQELPDRELRFVFRLLQVEYPLPKIKTLCLLLWGQLKVVHREGAVFIVRHHKKNYPLTTLQICENPKDHKIIIPTTPKIPKIPIKKHQGQEFHQSAPSMDEHPRPGAQLRTRSSLLPTVDKQQIPLSEHRP